MSGGTKIAIVIVFIIAIVGMGIAGYGIGKYNQAISLDEKVKTQWAQVDNQLKRRYDLIPNLVETVKGYAKHEKELFENIASARTKYFQPNQTTDQKIAASKQMDGLLSRLLLLKETYPQLKANQSFLKLQDSIEGTENRISVERKRYNDAALELNTFARSFPSSFFAALAGVKQATYYEVPAEQKETPKVKF
jgi:LemA protein